MFFFVTHQRAYSPQMHDNPHCDIVSVCSSESLQMTEDINFRKLYSFASCFFPLAFHVLVRLRLL